MKIQIQKFNADGTSAVTEVESGSAEHTKILADNQAVLAGLKSKADAASVETEAQRKANEILAAEQAKKDAVEFDRKVAERADLIVRATKLIGDFKADGKTSLEIKQEILKKVSPTFSLDGKSESEIDGALAFAATVEDPSKKKVNIDSTKLPSGSTQENTDAQDIEVVYGQHMSRLGTLTA